VTPGHYDRGCRFGAAILHDLPAAGRPWHAFRATQCDYV
jgi:hypothetical protein